MSFQQSYVLKILKKGMPKLYQYNENQNNKKLKYTKFSENLMKNLQKLYENKIPRINIKQIKIKSKILFQISYDKENKGWIVSDNLNNCVIFQQISEIDKLYLDNRIPKNLFQICKGCDILFRNILKKKESLNNNNINHNFLHEISENTFLGFFLEERDEIIFYSIVSNLQYNNSQFCLPFQSIEDICFKFGLPYEKSIILKTDLVTFEQIEQELKYIYRRISEDYASFQNYGAIILIEQDSEIITGFKIINQEMKILQKMLNFKFKKEEINNDIPKEEDELSNQVENFKAQVEENLINSDKINIFMNNLSKYHLPRCVHIYSKLFNDLIEDDTTTTCLEKLEEISKNIYKMGICNCIKENNQQNFSSLNLLSCLIPKNELDNYIVPILTNSKNICKENNKTLIFDNKANYKRLETNKSLFHFNKIKKKVKFVDEVYNKSLVEEILIKSFKGYNVKNNFIYGGNNLGSQNDNKTSSCCLVF